jgi:DNA-directed RNA polymerase III subunit RPC2
MVKTKTIELVGYDKLPAGQNATVAVMSYSGYDIEDALIVNRASADRGFGRCHVLKKQTIPLRQFPNGTSERLAMLPADQRPETHSWLDQDGLVAPGSVVSQGDLLAARETPMDTRGSGPSIVYKPSPVVHKLPEPTNIDKVMVTDAEDGSQLIKILTRQTRRPELGDKFSSRHGQKGVCGLIVPQQDMPFNDQGICPDVIMNPHGFPSRM